MRRGLSFFLVTIGIAALALTGCATQLAGDIRADFRSERVPVMLGAIGAPPAGRVIGLRGYLNTSNSQSVYDTPYYTITVHTTSYTASRDPIWSQLERSLNPNDGAVVMQSTGKTTFVVGIEGDLAKRK
jgi:hypothetical protein